MLYIFHGEDTHGQKQTLAKLQARSGDPSMLELNTTRVEGKRLVWREVRDLCNAMPFLSAKRLVIMEDWLTSKPDKAVVKALVAYLPDLPESTHLILMESKAVRDTNAVMKWALADKKRAYVKRFEQPKGRALERWIEQTVKEREGTITPRAVHTLAVNVGSDLAALENEIEKLVLYKGGGRVEVIDVERLSPYSAETSIFDMVDALGNRNGRAATLLFQKLLNEGADPFYLFSMFTRQFRLLIQVRECLDSNMKPPDIAKTVGMHPFVAGKMSKQARSFSLDQLEAIYAHLLDIDVQVKTGQTEMTTALNLLVANLAT